MNRPDELTFTLSYAGAAVAASLDEPIPYVLTPKSTRMNRRARIREAHVMMSHCKFSVGSRTGFFPCRWPSYVYRNDRRVWWAGPDGHRCRGARR